MSVVPDTRAAPRKHGVLYLIPTHLSAPTADNTASVLPTAVVATALRLNHYIAENAKTARAFLKAIGVSRPLAEISIIELDKHARSGDVSLLLAPLFRGEDVGLVSEAGAPAVADPGALLVAAAHSADIVVKPLVGPSSLLMALMASGLNGQSFAFHGYLPQERAARSKQIQTFEQYSRAQTMTQMFIETPYRNQALLIDLASILAPSTRLCIATDLTGELEWVCTRPVSAWRQSLPPLAKLPTMFLFLA